MSRVFGKGYQPSPKLPRNSVDMSFQNNLTLNMGGCYPCFCKEVLAGDSVSINTRFGLRFMPLVFPIQTKIRADIHYFYVRNRNLWKDWEDFYCNHPISSVMPYISQPNSKLKTGSIYDYMGIPTTYVGGYSTSVPISQESNPVCTGGIIGTSFVMDKAYSFDGFLSFIRKEYISGAPSTGPDTTNAVIPFRLSFNSAYRFQTPHSCPPTSESSYTSESGALYLSRFLVSDIPVSSYEPVTLFGSTFYRTTVTVRFSGGGSYFRTLLSRSVIGNNLYYLCGSHTSSSTFLTFGDGITAVDFSSDGNDVTLTLVSLLRSLPPTETQNVSFVLYSNLMDNPGVNESSKVLVVPASPWTVSAYVGTPEQATVEQLSNIPDSRFKLTDKLPISALPFRAYESIYNAFYRDERNNPLVVDGQPVYNKFLLSDEGGADTFDYQIRYRNWEQDFLTTAVPTPQQGNAPLVGITSSGVATFSDPETGAEYEVGLTASDGDHVDGVTYRENLPNSVARSLVNVVSSGISINDFRNVNSFQRWLETNIRKGYKYRDVLQAQTGVSPRYNVLDMPEFIGGASQIVDVRQIDQNSSSVDGSPLGSYAGQAYAVGSSKHRVTRFCDENGYIIGIISIVPTPNYSQLLPKHFLKTDVLDYYFEKFGKIGLQPIKYNEVCPIDTLVAGDDLNDTFGYQRAWYDYLASVDEVHGEFRTTLRDFLINRIFNQRPTLSPDFLLVKPEQTNNVFSVTETDDKILGQIVFDVKMKRQIPLFASPSLE